MANTSQKAVKEFFVYRDKYDNVQVVYSSEDTAKRNTKNGKYVKVILPVAESVDNLEASKITQAFQYFECLK